MRLSAFLPSTLLLTILATLSTSYAWKTPNDKVLLSQVKTLTLRGDAKTAHRRVPAAPQLQCLTPRTCRYYQVDLMRCTNQGSDYDDENIQWSCTANLPEDFRLGSTDVICEGYNSPEDLYVLKGSCGVEYRLVLTDKGEEKYGKGGPAMEGKTSAFGMVFFVIFVAVALRILHGIFKALRGDNRRAGGARGVDWFGGNGGGWGGGGGGGGGDNDEPPPPYSKYGSTSYRNTGETWRPGFWSGAGLGGAAGGAAGYAAGRAAGRQQSQPRSSSSSSSSSRSSPSTVNHTSTGFGSTSRR